MRPKCTEEAVGNLKGRMKLAVQSEILGSQSESVLNCV